MKNTITAALAASIVGLAAPSTALTVDTGNNPISIDQVTSNPKTDYSPGVIHISFRNTADVAAREVTFRIRDFAGHTADVEDLGTFSSGVTINHDFGPLLIADGAQVQVEHVEFADNSAWDAPAAPLAPSARRQASATPAPSLPAFE